MLSIEEMSDGMVPCYPPVIELTRTVLVRFGPTFREGELLYLQPNGTQYARPRALIGDPCLDAEETINVHDYWKAVDIHDEIQSIIDMTGVDSG